MTVLRKLIILGLAAVGGILVWETRGLKVFSGSAEQNHTKVQQVLGSVEDTSSQQENKTQLTGKRLLALALFILLAPVITAPLANRIIDRKSNTVNLLMLFGYTGLDVLAAYMIGAVSVGGILSAIVCLIALLAVFSYNLWICAFLARLRQA